MLGFYSFVGSRVEVPYDDSLVDGVVIREWDEEIYDEVVGMFDVEVNFANGGMDIVSVPRSDVVFYAE